MKHYSSGMYVRLGFAVAAHLEPEILIVDEVLAVGDVQFQRKCLGKLDDVARSGRTVLFVSHNMAAIQRLCTSAMLLQHGKLVRVGDVRSTVAAYLGGDARGGFVAAARTGEPQILSADLEDTAGRPLENAACTEPIVCRIQFTLPHRAPGTRIGIGVLSCDGIPIFTTNIRGCRFALSLRPRRVRSARDDSTRHAAGRRLSPGAVSLESRRDSRPARAGALVFR